MFTEKGNKFERLRRKINEVIGDGNQWSRSCMVCLHTKREEVDRVVELLKEFEIDPKDVEAEMLTLTDNFGFRPEWHKEGSGECDVYRVDFFAACYKFLK